MSVEALARGESLRLREVLSVPNIEHIFNWEMRRERSRFRQDLVNSINKVGLHRMLTLG